MKKPMKLNLSTLLLSTTAIATAMTLVACGKNYGTEKDPLKGYEAVNTAVTPHNNKARDQYVPFNIFQIVPVGNMTFVEGQESQVRFLTLLNMSAESKAKYALRAEDLPAGAAFRKEGDVYVLSWKPAVGTVNVSETDKSIPVKIKFVPVKENNPSYDVMAAQVAGRDTYIATLKVLFDVKQPVISDTVVFRPAQTVKHNQNASVEIEVLASGARDASDLQINTLRGPLKPARELVQMDGLIGQTDYPTVVRSSKTAAGVKAVFQVNFSTQRFADAVMAEIQKDSVLKKRYTDGNLKVVEAAFDVHVINTHSPSKSVNKTVVIKVELPEAPVKATANAGGTK